MLEPGRKVVVTMASDFVTLTDFSESELTSLLDLSDRLKRLWSSNRMPQNLKNKNVALVWDAGGFRIG